MASYSPHRFLWMFLVVLFAFGQVLNANPSTTQQTAAKQTAIPKNPSIPKTEIPPDDTGYGVRLDFSLSHRESPPGTTFFSTHLVFPNDHEISDRQLRQIAIEGYREMEAMFSWYQAQKPVPGLIKRQKPSVLTIIAIDRDVHGRKTREIIMASSHRLGGSVLGLDSPVSGQLDTCRADSSTDHKNDRRCGEVGALHLYSTTGRDPTALGREVRVGAITTRGKQQVEYVLIPPCGSDTGNCWGCNRLVANLTVLSEEGVAASPPDTTEFNIAALRQQHSVKIDQLLATSSFTDMEGAVGGCNADDTNAAPIELPGEWLKEALGTFRIDSLPQNVRDYLQTTGVTTFEDVKSRVASFMDSLGFDINEAGEWLEKDLARGDYIAREWLNYLRRLQPEQLACGGPEPATTLSSLNQLIVGIVEYGLLWHMWVRHTHPKRSILRIERLKTRDTCAELPTLEIKWTHDCKRVRNLEIGISTSPDYIYGNPKNQKIIATLSGPSGSLALQIADKTLYGTVFWTPIDVKFWLKSSTIPIDGLNKLVLSGDKYPWKHKDLILRAECVGPGARGTSSKNRHVVELSKLNIDAVYRHGGDMATFDLHVADWKERAICKYVNKLRYDFQVSNADYSGTSDEVVLYLYANKNGAKTTGKAITMGQGFGPGYTHSGDIPLEGVAPAGATKVDVKDITDATVSTVLAGLSDGPQWLMSGIKFTAEFADSPGTKMEMKKYSQGIDQSRWLDRDNDWDGFIRPADWEMGS